MQDAERSDRTASAHALGSSRHTRSLLLPIALHSIMSNVIMRSAYISEHFSHPGLYATYVIDRDSSVKSSFAAGAETRHAHCMDPDR